LPKTERKIGLASREEAVFFHELSHVGHKKLLGELKKGQDWRQEIVAELAAATLCKIVGKTSKHLGNSYQYIERYAESVKLTPWQACLKVISDTEKVLTLILDWKPLPPALSCSVTRERSRTGLWRERQVNRQISQQVPDRRDPPRS